MRVHILFVIHSQDPSDLPGAGNDGSLEYPMVFEAAFAFELVTDLPNANSQISQAGQYFLEYPIHFLFACFHHVHIPLTSAILPCLIFDKFRRVGFAVFVEVDLIVVGESHSQSHSFAALADVCDRDTQKSVVKEAVVIIE